MLKENQAEFEILGITKFWEEGYTGKGISIGNVEKAYIQSPLFHGKVFAPTGHQLSEPTNAHGNHTTFMEHEVAYDSDIYCLDMSFNNNNGKYSGPLIDKTIPFIKEKNISVINSSSWKLLSENRIGEITKDLRDILVMNASAGNSDYDGIVGYAKTDIWLAINASGYNDKNKEIRVRSYSSRGTQLDYSCFSGMFVKDFRPDYKNRVFQIEGTSFSSPIFTGMCALVQQFFLEKAGSTLNQYQMENFIKDHLVDLGDVGWDNDYGYGLFVLPNPKDIRVDKYIKITSPIVIPIEPPIIEIPEEPIIEKTSDIIIDISHHQIPSNIDYDKLSKQVGLVVIRTQYGSSLIDKHYKTHHAEFKKRGVPTASYAWVRGTSIKDMEVEATDFYNRTKDLEPTFWFLDVEEKSMSDMRSGVIAYVNKLRSLGVKKIGIYIAHHLYKDFNLDLSIVDAIWIPHYGLNNGTLNSKPSFFCDIHQYTSEGRLDGYSGDLDLNKIISGIPITYYTKEVIEPVVEPVIAPEIIKPVLLTYARVLKYGSKGDDVKALQVALTTLGYYSNLIDGSFGGLTNIAIRNLQRGTGITVDGLVGPLTIHSINLLLSIGVTQSSKAKYYRVGNAHIIETDPENIEIKILGNTLSNAKVYGVNGTFFDTPNPTLPNSCWAIATNEGKPIGGNSMLVSYATTIKRGTIVFYEDGTVEVLKVNSINEFKKKHKWSISGYTVYPSYDFKAEKMPSGIDYETAHTYIGFKGKSIYLIVKPSHMIKDIIPLVKQLGLEGCIVLDGGGSTQLRHPNGSYNSSRKINSSILLKEI